MSKQERKRLWLGIDYAVRDAAKRITDGLCYEWISSQDREALTELEGLIQNSVKITTSRRQVE